MHCQSLQIKTWPVGFDAHLLNKHECIPLTQMNILSADHIVQ